MKKSEAFFGDLLFPIGLSTIGDSHRWLNIKVSELAIFSLDLGSFGSARPLFIVWRLVEVRIGRFHGFLGRCCGEALRFVILPAKE